MITAQWLQSRWLGFIFSKISEILPSLLYSRWLFSLWRDLSIGYPRVKATRTVELLCCSR